MTCPHGFIQGTGCPDCHRQRTEPCGAFGCDQPAVVHGLRGDEWVPGWYCADHGRDVQQVPS